jgi:hypothetical protein
MYLQTQSILFCNIILPIFFVPHEFQSNMVARRIFVVILMLLKNLMLLKKKRKNHASSESFSSRLARQANGENEG